MIVIYWFTIVTNQLQICESYSAFDVFDLLPVALEVLDTAGVLV